MHPEQHATRIFEVIGLRNDVRGHGVHVAVGAFQRRTGVQRAGAGQRVHRTHGIASLRHGVMRGSEHRGDLTGGRLPCFRRVPQPRDAGMQILARRGDPHAMLGNGREHRGPLADARSGIDHAFAAR